MFKLSDLSKRVKSISLPLDFILLGCSSSRTTLGDWLFLSFDAASTEPLILFQFFDASFFRAALRCSILRCVSPSKEDDDDDDDEPTDDSEEDELGDGDNCGGPEEMGDSSSRESIDIIS